MLARHDLNQSNNELSVYNQSAFDPNNKQLASFCFFPYQLTTRRGKKGGGRSKKFCTKQLWPGSWLMAESARTTIALIFNMRGGRFGGLLFSHATAAVLPSPFAASADIDVSGAPFSTLSISTLRCRPFSRGSSTSSPSSAPSIALPSGELAEGGLFPDRYRFRITAPKFVFGRPKKPEQPCRRARSPRAPKRTRRRRRRRHRSNQFRRRPVGTRLRTEGLDRPVLGEPALRAGCVISCRWARIPIRASISTRSFSTPSGSR